MNEVTNTVAFMSFEIGIERIIHMHESFRKYQVIFIDHDDYEEIYDYKSVIQKYPEKNPEQQIVLRYPLFNLFERVTLQQKSKVTLNQFFI